MGDVSIDDVFFTAGACKESSAIGESCTFTDYSQCGFTQNSTISSLQWKTHSPSLHQLNAIPNIYDHTTGTTGGSYIYIDLENQGENLNGRLYSTYYPVTGNESYCLEFYYVLSGSNNTFNVYTESDAGTERTIFSRNYDHGLLWNKGEATLTTTSQFRIIFEILSGHFRQGLI